MKTPSWLAVAVLAVGMCGCRSMNNSSPGREAPLEDLKTTSTYDVLGATEGSSEGTSILFGLINIYDGQFGGVEKTGNWNVPGQDDTPGVWEFILFPFRAMGLFQDAGVRVRNTAFYNAIEAQQGADSLMAPRWDTETTSYILWKTVKAKVKGKGIRYNPTVVK